MSASRSLVAFVAVLMLGLAGLTAFRLAETAPTGDLTSFRSYGELASFLDRSTSFAGGFPFAEGDVVALGGTLSGRTDFSGTNVQVEGVDELDFMKTDGSHVYVASGDEVAILRAYPSTDMSVVARIKLGEAAASLGNFSTVQAVGLFVYEDRLVVIASAYEGEQVYPPEQTLDVRFWIPIQAQTLALVFDLDRIDQPTLARAEGVSGNPLDARMIAPYVYVVSHQTILKVNETYTVPVVCDPGACTSLDPRRIFYDPETRDASSFTNVLAFDVLGGASGLLSVLTGYTSTLYMSHEALYLTVLKWEGSGGFRDVSPTMRTTIHKVRAEGIDLRVVARADVPGTLLNQFAMDEHEGYLRVATTVQEFSSRQTATRNNLYVLNETLAPVGRLEGLAPGESIFSARFLGDRAYLVTFEKVDPLFVIDLSDPAEPRVLGYLKIPGYSDYLHPFDGGLVLGLGKDSVQAEGGGFSWYQGLKLSLFDVTDVAHPVERFRYAIGDRGTESEAAHDHKAFLFDSARGLLVIPVNLFEIDPADYPEGWPPYTYGDFVWQGAYVLSVTPETGFELRGRITHMPDVPGGPIELYAYGGFAVRRSFTIGDVLYTVSPSAIKANSLVDLTELGFLVYGTPPPDVPTR